MTIMDKFFIVVKAVAIYLFIVYFIYAIKMPVNIFYAGALLLILYYVAVFSCPLLRYTDAWKKFWK
ncbi:hypothetical protein GF322_05055 [Candidatus Dependentiae bacterium]|nr:hypothetical protein [Candidatus Dependentiae bacterium]